MKFWERWKEMWRKRREERKAWREAWGFVPLYYIRYQQSPEFHEWHCQQLYKMLEIYEQQDARRERREKALEEKLRLKMEKKEQKARRK